MNPSLCRASAWGLVAATWAVSAPADAPAALVRVGGVEVATLEVTRALEACWAESNDRARLSSCLQGERSVPWLLSRAADGGRLATRPELVPARSELLGRALLQRLAREIAQPSAEAIAQARLEQAAEFDKPKRIRIFRILVSDRVQAEELRARLGSGATLTAWRALCREVSLDKATHERGGDLGFVAPDGSTDVPEVSADPVLYAAVSVLQDGELAAAPVAEGNRFALIWRRGSLPAVRSGEKELTPLLVASLQRKAVAEQTRTLIATLKSAHLRDLHPDALERLRGAGRLYPLR